MNVTTPPTTEGNAEAQQESVSHDGDAIELPGACAPSAPPAGSIEAQAICTACGTSNPPNEAYCEACGAELTAQAVSSDTLSPLAVDSLVGDRYCLEKLLMQGDCNIYLASSRDDTFIIKEAPADGNAFEAEITKLQRIAYPTVTKFVERIDQEHRCYLICTAPRTIAPLHIVYLSSWREVVRATLSLCQALQKLHEARVLLNDFSAVQWNENEGRVFIYELAHAMDVPVPVEQSDEDDDAQAVWADANFAAPEVQRNWLAEIGVASDLYGLAALCYQLLLGKPYDPPTPANSPPPNADNQTLSLPPALYRTLLTCLAPDPTVRPNSIEPFKNELISLLTIGHHQWSTGSDVGMRRNQNQDAYFTQSAVFYAQSEQIVVGLYLVADGMGGAQAGDLASRIVVETCQKIWSEMFSEAEFCRKADSVWLDWGCGILQKANTAIVDAADGAEMGSTATLCFVLNQRAYFAHIGDSRAYLIDGEKIEQLTDDHSLVARLVRIGKLTPDEAENHPQQHIIYKALGVDREVEPDCFVRLLSPEQALLLCSDGLNGMVSDDQILQVASNDSLSHTEKMNLLINLANEAGGKDNITAVYVTFH